MFNLTSKLFSSVLMTSVVVLIFRLEAKRSLNNKPMNEKKKFVRNRTIINLPRATEKIKNRRTVIDYSGKLSDFIRRERVGYGANVQTVRKIC